MPGFLYGYQQFREQIESPIVRDQDQEALKQFQTMIRPFSGSGGNHPSASDLL